MVKVVTHSGSFHADDVFAVATVILSLREGEEVEIIRSRDKEVIESADYVVDVGLEYNPERKRFDHHQPGGAGVRENGIPYASFGLVWKEYGEKLAGSNEIARTVEEKLIYFVDAIDNGVRLSDPIFEGIREYSISDYLYSYWINEQSEEEEVDRIFRRVVGLAKDLLEREIKKAQNIADEEKLVEEIYNNTEDKRLIVMDRHLAWGRILVKKPEPLIVVYPTPSGNWSAKTVRINVHEFESRIYYPEAWAGLVDGELAEVSGVPDAVFCHKDRFTAVAKTKEGAIALAKTCLSMN